ncbi:Ion transport protein-domain-containing protein [Lactarius indigo]|nr:Ion transport protein-domain-containing protein [Lactarius indigo]
MQRMLHRDYYTCLLGNVGMCTTTNLKRYCLHFVDFVDCSAKVHIRDEGIMHLGSSSTVFFNCRRLMHSPRRGYRLGDLQRRPRQRPKTQHCHMTDGQYWTIPSTTSTFDDSTHLSANMSSEPTDGGNWRTDSENYATRSIPQELRRISVRVVNFSSSSIEDEDHVRYYSIRSVSIVPAVRSAATSPSTHPTANLGRKGTLLHHLRSFYRNASRPFALPGLSSRYDPPAPLSDASAATSSATLVNSVPLARKRADTSASLLEKTPSSSSTIVTGTTPYTTPAQDTLMLPFQFTMRLARDVTRRNLPYLRHSWTRNDAIAVVAFWITFVLAQTGAECGWYHIGIFRALSVLWTARLLTITSGTTTIMRLLKTARPLLASVAYFVLFAMAVFSITGIQTFKGSLRRLCYSEPTLGEPETKLSQSCGGYIDPGNFTVMPYITQGGRNVTIKGYICRSARSARSSHSISEANNPQGNIESFDTIYFAALQVFIVASAIGGGNTKERASSASPLQRIVDEQDEAWAAGVAGRRRAAHRNLVQDLYEHIRWCWVALALASLVLQATREVDITPTHQQILNIGKLVLTIVFDVEITVRFVAYLPDWRGVFVQGNIHLDLVLAIGSTVIQIPTKTLVQNYSLPASERRPTHVHTTARGSRGCIRHVTNKSLSILQMLFIGDIQSDDVPLNTLRHACKQSTTLRNSADEDTVDTYTYPALWGPNISVGSTCGITGTVVGEHADSD